MTQKKPTSNEVDKKSMDFNDFQKNIMDPYLRGKAENEIPASDLLARSLLPPMTALQRSFAAVATEFPGYDSAKCVACMECVVECPDAAIYGRVSTESEMSEALAQVANTELQTHLKSRFGKTTKFWNTYEKKGQTPGYFSIWIDPDKCKGCGECVQVCEDHGALVMKPKMDHAMSLEQSAMNFAYKTLPSTRKSFVNDRLLSDLFLREEAWVYQGGAGSCKGCGEITALKMALTATAAVSGKKMAIVAATGCNSVFSSTYPYNIFNVPWTNPLFENAPATAIGVRMRLNQEGNSDTKVWVVGGDGAMTDIGFQSLSRLLVSGADINVLVLDTQVYSNTGGQTSGATFMGQNAKMSAFGKAAIGKTERRKELGLISLMHPDVYVAQVSPGYFNHFLRAVIGGIEYQGPSIILAYAPCMPEHGIADDAAYERSQAAVVSRAFPLFVHDPRKGKTMKERLDLRGNPSLAEDWHKDPKTGEVRDFMWFAKKEERFSPLFRGEGETHPVLQQSQEDRLKNWDFLRVLAGLK